MSTFGKIGARDLVWKPPYDAEVEYLESTGTQYIDTGVIVRLTNATAGNVLRMSCSINYPSAPASGFMANGTTVAYFGINIRSEWRLNVIFGGRASPAAFDDVVMTYSRTAGSLIVNGASVLNNTGGGADGHYVGVFATLNNAAGASNFSICKISYMQICYPDAHTLVRDFIPVRVGSGSSAVGYLYDRANPDGGLLGNGLYGNAGTGTFILGPDKT